MKEKILLDFERDREERKAKDERLRAARARLERQSDSERVAVSRDGSVQHLGVDGRRPGAEGRRYSVTGDEDTIAVTLPPATKPHEADK
jgi:hypothetical protein